MKKTISFVLAGSFLLTAFLSGCATTQTIGSKEANEMFVYRVIPTFMGAVTGALLGGKKKRAEGAIAGAAFGYIGGVTFEELKKKAVKDALASKEGEARYKDKKGNTVEVKVVKQPKYQEDCKEVVLTTTDADGKETVKTEKICEIRTTKYTY